MILFTYDNVTIRDTDLQYMNDKQWLNDQCILFYIAYLKNSKKEIIQQNNVFLMEPQFAGLISYCQSYEQVIEMTSFMNFQQFDYIIVPLNNNQNPLISQGTHWSMLLFHKKLKSFYHFDSVQNQNGSVAKQMKQQLEWALYQQKQQNSKQINQLKVAECKQQNNSYDCGIYLLNNIENVLESLACNINVETNHEKFDVYGLRSNIKHLMQQLIKK